MKKTILIVSVLVAILMMTGCGAGAYQGNISFGNNKDKIKSSNNMTKEEANNQVNDIKNYMKEQFGEEVAQIIDDNKDNIINGAEQIVEDLKEVKVRDLTAYNRAIISGKELHAFVDKYKGNPDIAIVVSTSALGGVYATKGESYVGKVGYDNLPIVYIVEDNGIIWSSGINYNALYQGNLKTNTDGTKYYDEVGFAKDTSGKVKVYTNFVDAGIDPSYTEHIAGSSKFNTTLIKNKKGKITGIFFEEHL